jgi:gliding motility-associated-like protein
MRKLCFLSTLVLSVLVCTNVSAQDFSNKGKDFWVGYGYHQVMTAGNAQQMVLYFAADQNSNVTVSIPALGYTQNYFVPAGGVVTSSPLPKTGGQDARLLSEGYASKGIHITSDKAIVAYAHIYNNNVSGATILYPTNTLGKEYYSVNFTNISNSPNSNCWFYVIATDTGTTTVEITPSANTTAGWVGGTTYTVQLTQGQIYNVMGTYSGSFGVDLSGSLVKSINTGSGCKKIGVFSGSGRISITCNGNSSSSDNYMVQAMPKAAWGKKYLTVPAYQNPQPPITNNAFGFYRICVSDPTTVVTVNGAPIGVPLVGNFYYQLGQLNVPQLIEADKPIMVAQYLTSQGACGNIGVGDPEVIYLSSVEQNINRVLWNATSNFAIAQHYVNVVIPNTGTALSSFRLDGVPVGPAAFITHPFEPNFSYLRSAVTPGQHLIQSDSGFNAIAYGYGTTESYGYNAGTNIKDLFQFINIRNPLGTVNFPATCRNTPFRLSIVFPYIPTQIDWVFGAPLNAMGFNDTTLLNPTPDSSWVVAGRTIYRFQLPRTYTITAVGVYPIRVIATNPTPDGCGNLQEIEFDLEVFEPPIADFTFTTNGCFTSPVNFFDNSNTGGRPVISRFWNFGDANTSTINNPTHTYAAPGSYLVKYTLVTDVGCLADTADHIVTLDPAPTALFTTTGPYCVNQPIAFTDQSTPGGTSTLQEWVWDFGDGSPPVTVIAPNPPNQTHSYAAPGTYNATLRVETTSGCQSILFTLPVVIEANGTVNLSSAPGTDNQTICINNPIIDITYTVGGSSTGGSVAGLPAGVTGTFAGGIITISGTPTVAGTFNYTVSTTGPCVNPTATGVINVTGDGSITLSSAPGTDNQTVCVNAPITPITYTVGGTGTGGSVAGLPAGVTGTFAGGVITITGAPTVAGTFNYTVNTTGPCVNPTATGTITVTLNATVTLSSAPGSDNQTVCINTPISNITYAIGGSGTGGTVSGLPAGVTGTYASGVVTISGTPTVAGVFNYTVDATGTCAGSAATGTITVTADGSVTLTSGAGTDNQNVCINQAIAAITYSVGGSGTGGSVTGLPPGVTGNFAGGVITITGAPTAIGIFNYTVNTTGPCINPTATGTITVTANATITLTSAPGTDNQTVCINVPITNIVYAVAGSGTGGSVSGLPPGVTGVFTGGTLTISGTPTTTGTFNYTVTTTGPCGTPTATGTITVDPDATINLTSAPGTEAQELCINLPIANITYAVGGSGTGATVTGLPAGVNGVFAGGVFTISGTPSVAGTFNYTVTTTGVCASASRSGTIIVNALPTANFSSSLPACESTSITFTDLSIANSGNIISWAWDFGDGNTSTVQNPTHTYATPGTYTVTLTVTTDKGCVSVVLSQQITVYSKPNADFLVPEVCLSDTWAQFTDLSTATPPDVVTAWAWDFGDGGTSTLQNPQHSYTAVGSYNVTLTVTTNRGCTDVIVQTLFVNGSFPVADFTVQNPAGLCANDSVSIVEASTVFPGTITKVEIYWDNVGAPGTFDIDNSPTTGKVYKHKYPTLTTTQTYTIRYRAYSGGVCVNDRFRDVIVNAAPAVVFNVMPSICYDAAPWQIPPAIARETGGVTGTGVFTGPGVSTSGLFTPTVAGIGTHRIRYTFTSNAGCVDTASNLITVWDTASARIDVQALICERSPVNFNSSNSSIPAGNGTITGWNWNFGDPASGAQNTSTLAAPTHLFTGWGPYTVTLSVLTSNGCRSTVSTLPITVNPLARPNFSFPAVSCLPNANVQFTNNSTMPDGTPMSYFWDFGDPPSGAVNNSTGTNPSHTYVGTGPYNVNLEVTSTAGCVHDTTIVLSSIHPAPQASFITDPIDVCIGGSITFTNTSNPADGTLQSLNWDLDNGVTRTVPSFTYTYPVAGTYDVTLFITNSWNCRSNTFTQTVSVNPYPPVDAGPNKFMLEGGQAQLTPIVNVSYPVTYSWSPGVYLNDSTLASPIARPPTDMYFRVTVTSDKGCSAWDTVFVKVLKKPDIPNIFSPNGDGVNDRWVIAYLDSYPECTVEIVNRYGQLVYRSVGYATPWDGKVNGKDVPVGTYYYVVSPKNGRAPITGYVDIIR